MIVAVVALFVAMGGTTYAVRSLPSKSVGSKQIRNKAVHTRHIKARNVTRTKIARNAIDTSLVKRDGIHGSDILEASLATVPSAKDAANAANAAKVGGRTVQKFSFIVATGTGPTDVLNLDGLQLKATCAPGPVLTVTATTSVGGAFIHSGGTQSTAPPTDTAWYQSDDDFSITDTFNPLPSTASDVSGTLTYLRQDLEIVTANFLAQQTGTGCVFAGTAIG
jgi:hypothetical protein